MSPPQAPSFAGPERRGFVRDAVSTTSTFSCRQVATSQSSNPGSATAGEIETAVSGVQSGRGSTHAGAYDANRQGLQPEGLQDSLADVSAQPKEKNRQWRNPRPWSRSVTIGPSRKFRALRTTNGVKDRPPLKRCRTPLGSSSMGTRSACYLVRAESKATPAADREPLETRYLVDSEPSKALERNRSCPDSHSVDSRCF